MGSGQNIIFARVDFQDSGAWAMTTPPTFTNLDFPWFPPNLRKFSPSQKSQPFFQGPQKRSMVFFHLQNFQQRSAALICFGHQGVM